MQTVSLLRIIFYTRYVFYINITIIYIAFEMLRSFDDLAHFAKEEIETQKDD